MRGYNVLAVVTPQQIILPSEVTTVANNVQRLQAILTNARVMVELLLGEDGMLRAAVADAGYWSEGSAASQMEECERFSATRQDRKQRVELCDSALPRGRILKGLSARGRMQRKLRRKRGRIIYARRGASVEPVFGQMRDRPGFTPPAAWVTLEADWGHSLPDRFCSALIAVQCRRMIVIRHPPRATRRIDRRRAPPRAQAPSPAGRS